MKEYKIVKEQSEEALEKTVNKLLLEGWELQGGLFICPGTSACMISIFYQALYKYQMK